MIKSLRKKFILVAMGSTFVVLMAIMGIMLFSNYSKMMERTDQLLQILAENDGEFPGAPENLPQLKENDSIRPIKKKMDDRPKDWTEETPYETRFFSVMLDKQGSVTETKLGNIASVEQTDAQNYAQDIVQSGKKKGLYDHYRYYVDEMDDGYTVIFVDCSRDLKSYRNLVMTTVSVSLLGLVLVLVLVVIFSRLVFKPVEESDRKQKQFITDASHELKTPLTIIDANTEVMEMLSGENEWTRSTRKQVKRLADLTQQMVMLSRTDEGKQAGILEPFCLSDAVADAAEPFFTVAEARGKCLSVDIEEGLVLNGDEAQIRQLISLLLDNAVKYSDENGKIWLVLKKKGKKSVLEVKNTVEQIQQGKMDILFERFYRTDESRNSATGGSGIGLSIAKAIVELHRGKIRAVSEDGKSLCVTATF